MEKEDEKRGIIILSYHEIQNNSAYMEQNILVYRKNQVLHILLSYIYLYL